MWLPSALLLLLLLLLRQGQRQPEQNNLGGCPTQTRQKNDTGLALVYGTKKQSAPPLTQTLRKRRASNTPTQWPRLALQLCASVP